MRPFTITVLTGHCARATTQRTRLAPRIRMSVLVTTYITSCVLCRIPSNPALPSRSCRRGLFHPSLNVYAHHEQPERQQYFCDCGSREIREDLGLQRRRQKEGEAVDQVPRALDRQQHANESGKELRIDDEVSHREAIKSEKYQADRETVFEQN